MVHRSTCLCLLLWTGCWSTVVPFQAIRHVAPKYPRSSACTGRLPRPSLPTSTKSPSVGLDATTVALSGLDALFQSAPYAIAAVTCGLKASSADWVAQVHQHQPPKHSVTDESSPTKATRCRIDLKRNISFLLYGAIYQGMAQEFIYNRLYPTLFGAGTSIGVVLTKVAFDLLIQTTMVTLPIAYLTKALIYKYTWRESMRRYRNDIFHNGLLTKYYMIWGPVQCLTFSIIPAHFRVSFVACVSFFWLIILSNLTNNGTPTARDESVLATERPKCEFVDGMTCNIDG